MCLMSLFYFNWVYFFRMNNRLLVEIIFSVAKYKTVLGKKVLLV